MAEQKPLHPWDKSLGWAAVRYQRNDWPPIHRREQRIANALLVCSQRLGARTTKREWDRFFRLKRRLMGIATAEGAQRAVLVDWKRERYEQEVSPWRSHPTN